MSAVRDKPTSLTAKLFYRLLNSVSYLNLDLNAEEFCIVSRRAMNFVLKAKEPFGYRKTLHGSSGYPCATALFKAICSDSSLLETSFFERLGRALDVLIPFPNIGASLALVFWVVFIVMSLCMGLYAINSYSFQSEAAPGWTTLSLFLSAGFSGMFLFVGILGENGCLLLMGMRSRTPCSVSPEKLIVSS